MRLTHKMTSKTYCNLLQLLTSFFAICAHATFTYNHNFDENDCKNKANLLKRKLKKVRFFDQKIIEAII